MHIVGMVLDLYQNLIYYDVIMHFLGGLAAAMISLFILKKINLTYTLLRLVIAVFLIGLAWEIYDFFWDSWLAVNYNLSLLQISFGDTIIDLFFGVLGVLAAGFVFHQKQFIYYKILKN